MAPIAMRQTSYLPDPPVLPTPVPQQIAASSMESRDYFAWAAARLPLAERDAVHTAYANTKVHPLLRDIPTAAPNDPTLPKAITALPTHAPFLKERLSGALEAAPLFLAHGVGAAIAGVTHAIGFPLPGIVATAALPLAMTLDDATTTNGIQRPSWFYTAFPTLLTGASMLFQANDLAGSAIVAATAFLTGLPFLANEIARTWKEQDATWERAQLVRSAFNHMQSMDPRRRLVEEPAILSAWAQKQAAQCEDPAKKAQWEVISAAAKDLTPELESYRSAILDYFMQQLREAPQKLQSLQEFHMEGDVYSSLLKWRGSIYAQSLDLYERAEALLEADSPPSDSNEVMYRFL